MEWAEDNIPNVQLPQCRNSSHRLAECSWPARKQLGRVKEQELVSVVLEETPGGVEPERTEPSSTHIVQPRAKQRRR